MLTAMSYARRSVHEVAHTGPVRSAGSGSARRHARACAARGGADHHQQLPTADDDPAELPTADDDPIGAANC